MMGVLSPRTRQHVSQTGKPHGLSDQLGVAAIATQSTALHVGILPPDPPVARAARCLLLVAHSASSVLEEVTVSDE